MEKITFKINTEDLIEELQDDCKELERELVKTKVKVKSLGEFVKSYSEKFEYINQVDNGFEFTNRLNSQKANEKTMFEKKLEELGIKHKLIKPRTPRHNGKVERSHRKDQERFYYKRIFVSFEDFKEKLRHWTREYNNFPMKPLNWKSPNEKYLQFIGM